MNNRGCAKICHMEKDDLFEDLRIITLNMRIMFFLYICYREVTPVQSVGGDLLFEVRFRFLVTCLAGQVWLVHGLGRSRRSTRYDQPSRHGVHTSQWSVFRQVVDESKSEIWSQNLI